MSDGNQAHKNEANRGSGSTHTPDSKYRPSFENERDQQTRGRDDDETLSRDTNDRNNDDFEENYRERYHLTEEGKKAQQRRTDVRDLPQETPSENREIPDRGKQGDSSLGSGIRGGSTEDVEFGRDRGITEKRSRH